MSGTIKNVRFWNNIPTGTVRGKPINFQMELHFQEIVNEVT